MTDEKCCHIVAELNTANVSAGITTTSLHFSHDTTRIIIPACTPAKPQVVDPLTIPLTLTAEQAGSTVKLTAVISTIYYRLNSKDMWTPYVSGTEIKLSKTGDYVQFWNNADNLNINSTYANFSMTGKVSASGNIMSLANWREDVPNACFRLLFNECSSLTSIPLMPATKIELHGYNQMFFGCSITEVKLPAISYYGSSSMRAMFCNCKSLKLVEVGFTLWNKTALSIWLQNTASNGTFIKPSALPEEYGYDCIPKGWTVINKN